MSLWAELKRRNVVRVAIAYLVVAWLLAQVAATFFPALQLPEWTVTFVAALLILGFPLAIALSWAYELTPEGLKKKQENQENWLTRDPEIKCYLPGVPRANYMPFPFQIFQSNSAFFMAYEYAGAVRNIYLKDPGPARIDSSCEPFPNTGAKPRFTI